MTIDTSPGQTAASGTRRGGRVSRTSTPRLVDFAALLSRLNREFTGGVSPGRVIAAIAHAQLNVRRTSPAVWRSNDGSYASAVERAAREYLKQQAPAAPPAERATSNGQRQSRGPRSGWLDATEGGNAAPLGRLLTAQARDRAAVVRDHAAQARDQAAALRDRAVDPRIADGAFRDRQQAAIDREWAARDRDASAGTWLPSRRS